MRWFSVKWWASVFAVYRSDQLWRSRKKGRIPPDMRRIERWGSKKKSINQVMTMKKFCKKRRNLFLWHKSNKPRIGSMLNKSGLEGAKEEKDYIESIGYWQPMDSEGCIRSTTVSVTVWYRQILANIIQIYTNIRQISANIDQYWQPMDSKGSRDATPHPVSVTFCYRF